MPKRDRATGEVRCKQCGRWVYRLRFGGICERCSVDEELKADEAR